MSTTANVERDARGRTSPARRTVGWILVVAALAVGLVLPLTGSLFSGVIVSLLAVALAGVVGARRYGWGLIVAFFAISYVVSFFWENLSVMTGFPFGDYYYTLMPQLFYVPIVIGVSYFGIGFASWMTTNVLLGGADNRLDLRTRVGRVNVVALPVLSGAVMTMFDVGIDSISSTVRNTWVWEDGGGVFGVPFSNYLGWWFVTWTFFQIFALILAVRQTRHPAGSAPSLPEIPHLQPVLVYLTYGVSSISVFIGYTDPAVVVDETGVSWASAAIFETLMVFNLFSIVPVALLATARIAQGALRGA